MAGKLNFLKYLDMYGQPIQFTYRNSKVFASTCGVITSLVAIILILVYSLLLISDVLSWNKPRLLEITTNLYNPYKYFLLPDFPGLFNNTSPILPTKGNYTNDTQTMQVSIGLQDVKTLKFFPIDPKYFNLRFSSYNKNVNNLTSNSIFYDYCTRFPFTSNNLFESLKLNRTYCLYSPFTVEGNMYNSNFNKMLITLNFCTNSTYYTLPKTKIVEYQRLNFLYNNWVMKGNYSYRDYYRPLNELQEIVRLNSNATAIQTACLGPIILPECNVLSDNTINSSINNSTNTNSSRLLQTSNTTTYNNSEDNYFSSINPYSESLYDISSNSNRNLTNTEIQNGYLKLVCAPQSEIIKRIRKTSLVFLFSRSELNSTNADKSVSSSLSFLNLYPSYSLKKTITAVLSNDITLTYSSIIPSSIYNSSTIDYLMRLNLDLEGTSYSDVDLASPFLTIEVISGSTLTTYIRKFRDIFDVSGVIGGLSNIIILVGFVIAYHIVQLKLRESLINEFYSVIDSNNLKNVSKKFKEYLNERKSNKDALKHSTILEEFFDEKLVNNLSLENVDPKVFAKYEIVYEVFKHKVNSNLRYTPLEIFANSICCCFLTRRMKLKNKTFDKAWNRLVEDADFLAIIKSVQEFENLKKAFLDESQLDLFNCFRNEEIIANRVKKVIKEGSNDDKDFDSLKRLKENLEKLNTDERSIDEFDFKLLNNLVDRRKIIKDFIGDKIKMHNAIERLKEEEPGLNSDLKISDGNKKQLKELTQKDFRNIIEIFQK